MRAPRTNPVRVRTMGSAGVPELTTGRPLDVGQPPCHPAADRHRSRCANAPPTRLSAGSAALGAWRSARTAGAARTVRAVTVVVAAHPRVALAHTGLDPCDSKVLVEL